jgi:two-component system chemotaxis response regulator CheB
MGNDGTDGMKAIKRAGGKTLVQDEQSCVVYGMPRAVVEAGVADKIAPLGSLASEIVNMV